MLGMQSRGASSRFDVQRQRGTGQRRFLQLAMVCMNIPNGKSRITAKLSQPPKRRAPVRSAAPKRPSKLAKEHGLTAAQEAEIREAFGLFAVQHPDYESSKEGVLRRDDVRRCLMYDGPRNHHHTRILTCSQAL